MMTMIFIFMWMFTILLMSSLNPVKMSMILILLSSTLFSIFYLNNTSSWFPMIYFMIFIGGIMITFVILCAVMPNEKTLKTKKMIFSTMMMIMLTFFCLQINMSSENQIMHQMKWFFQSSLTFEMLMLMILSYFLSFIFILSKETSSLRSNLC